jgi:hypothetical protein
MNFSLRLETALENDELVALKLPFMSMAVFGRLITVTLHKSVTLGHP